MSVAWSAGTAQQVEVTAGRAGRVTLRGAMFAAAFDLVDSGTHRTVPVVRDGDRATFTARPAHRYRATPRP